MKILHHYLRRQISQSLLLFMGLIAGLQLCLNLLSQLKDLDSGQYKVLTMILYVLLELPQQMYSLFPIILFLGNLFALNLLAIHQELLSLRCLGLSAAKLLKRLCLINFVFIFFAFLMGEGGALKLMEIAQHKKLIATSNGQAFLDGQSVWLRIIPFVIYINRIESPEHWHDVTLYEFTPEKKLYQSIFAKDVLYKDGSWYLKSAQKTIFMKDKTTNNQRSLIEKINLVFNPGLLKSEQNTSQQRLDLWHLYKSIRYQEQNHLYSQHFRFALWQRLLLPFSCFVMVLLAQVFIPIHQRMHSLNRRLGLGIIFAFIFYLSSAFLGPFCLVYQIPPFIAAMSPLIFFTVLGLSILQR